jgi:hypothetical protein
VARRTGLPSDIMSRRRGRNDILPRLAIAPHPQLTTNKSAFSPLDKIARQSTPGWRAVWMECCVHDLPPTPPTVRNLVSYAGMSVTRGTKSQALLQRERHVSGALSRHGTTGGSRRLFNGRTRRQGRISQGATAPAAWRCWRRCAGPHPRGKVAKLGEIVAPGRWMRARSRSGAEEE